MPEISQLLDGNSSPWVLEPVGLADTEEFMDASRTVNRRRNSTDNLFEIIPHSMISYKGGSGDGIKVPSVHFASGGNEVFGVVLDSELIVQEEHKIRRIKFSSKVDFILWRRSIILVGLSSSELVLVNPNTFEIQESRKVSKVGSSSRFFVDAAIHSNPNPHKIDVLAVGADGVVYSFHNISLSDGTLDSTHDQNVSVDIDVGSVTGTRIKLLEDTANVVYALSPARNILIFGEQNGVISFHDVEQEREKVLKVSQSVNIVQDLGLQGQGTVIKKLKAFEGLLFLLLSNGNLEILLDEVLFCTERLQLEQTMIVHDFDLVMTNEEVKLWALYGTPDFSENYVGIFGGPRFTCDFSVNIPKLRPGAATTRFMFPSQATPFEEPSAFIEITSECTKVYKMLETSTDATIQKLLARGKFDDAVALAEQYGKDLDIVYKAKARAKYNELGNGMKASVFEELINSLEKIRDSTFICDFCCQNRFLQLDWIRRILAVGKLRVKDAALSTGKNLLLTIKKFYTFEQVYPEGGIQDWLGFISEENTMFQQCKWFLNKLEFSKCEKVWRRHFDEFISSLSLESFGPFFLILFGKKLQSQDSISLFKCILPFAVGKCAESQYSDELCKSVDLNEFQLEKVAMLVDIAKRQVCSLEREKLWPMEALEFSKIVIDVVKQSLKELESSNQRGISNQVLIYWEILKKMENIVQNLVELADLKKHHSIRIPFQRYIDDNVFEVVNSMLFELFHRPEIEAFIQNFLTPFAARKGLELDVLYSEHVKAVVADIPFHINSVDIPQEERLICLISHVSNIESKLRSILTIAEEWPVPWSPNINAMIVTCLRTTVQEGNCAELLRTINIMRVQVPYRCLLQKYRLTGTKVHNYFGVKLALSRIIMSNKPNYYQDCLELIKHTGGFVDKEKLKSIEFGLKVRNGGPIDEIVMAGWEPKLLKRLLARCLQEFKMGSTDIYDDEELSRIIDISKIISNVLDDRKSTEFLKLREVFPSLSDPELVYDENYPYSVLNEIMPLCFQNSSCEIIRLCKKLSDITFSHFPSILVAATAYYARPATSSELKKSWELIHRIVSTPGCSNVGSDSTLVQNSALRVAQFLMLHCPEASDENLDNLQRFITLLTSYDNGIEEAVRMLGVVQIFIALREQEIPLEKEFLQIYSWMFIDGIPVVSQFFDALRYFGTTILKFGDKDLFMKAVGFVTKDFTSSLVGTENSSMIQFVKKTKDLQKELYRSADSFMEPESNQKILNLVESLKREAHIVVTPYALKQRSKLKFLDKLLAQNYFSLAAQVAVVFEVFSNASSSWSRILRGFMENGDMKDLRKVLLDLRNVSELWMLQEFSEGWKMVSELDGDSGFLDLCPIPLD